MRETPAEQSSNVGPESSWKLSDLAPKKEQAGAIVGGLFEATTPTPTPTPPATPTPTPTPKPPIDIGHGNGGDAG